MTRAVFVDIVARARAGTISLDVVAEISNEFLEILQRLPDHAHLPDQEFNSVFDAFLSAAKAGRVPYDAVREFATSYSITSRSLHCNHYMKASLNARSKLDAAVSEVQSLMGFGPNKPNSASVSNRTLANARTACKHAEEIVQLVNVCLLRAEIERASLSLYRAIL